MFSTMFKQFTSVRELQDMNQVEITERAKILEHVLSKSIKKQLTLDSEVIFIREDEAVRLHLRQHAVGFSVYATPESESTMKTGVQDYHNRDAAIRCIIERYMAVNPLRLVKVPDVYEK